MNKHCWFFLFGAALLTTSAAAAGAQAASADIPVTLAEAIQQGLSARIQLNIAGAEVSKAQGSLAEARGGYWPELGIEANTGKTKSDDDFTGIQANATVGGNPVVVNVTRTVPAYTSSAALKANLNLYAGGQTRARISEARGGVTAAVADREQRRREIVIDIIRSYWSVRRAQLRVAVSVDSATLAQREVALAEAKVDLGKGSRIALAEKKLALLQKQVDRKKADLDLSDAYRRYLTALGHDARAQKTALPGPALTDSPDGLDVQALLAPYVPQQAPELLKAQANLRMARARKRAARSEYFARVDVYARYQDVGRGDDSLSGSFDDWHHAETVVGLGVSWKLFNGLQSHYRVAQATDEVARATLALELARQEYGAGADDRDNAIGRLTQEVELAQRQLEISREKENIAREGVEAGRVTTLDYEAAKFAIRDAEVRVQVASMEHVSASMEQLLLSARDMPAETLAP